MGAKGMTGTQDSHLAAKKSEEVVSPEPNPTSAEVEEQRAKLQAEDVKRRDAYRTAHSGVIRSGASHEHTWTNPPKQVFVCADCDAVRFEE